MNDDQSPERLYVDDSIYVMGARADVGTATRGYSPVSPEWAAESNDIVEPDDDAENGALADVGPATRESSPPSPEWAAESADIVEPDDDTFSSSGYEADFNEDTDISQ